MPPASGADDADASSSVNSGNCGVCVPIDLAGCKLSCLACGCKATSKTQFTRLSLIAKYGHTEPWWKYRYNQDSATRACVSKKPSGKFCRTCQNVFAALGLDAQYDDLQEFITHCTKPEHADQSRGFFASRKFWVQEHNKDEDAAINLKGSEQLYQVFTKLLSIEEKSRNFTAPKWEFVAKDSWDEKADGKFDPALLVKETIFDEVVEGIYVLRGRKGVFGCKEMEKKSTQKVTEEDDGQGPFAEQRIARKQQAINAGSKAARAARTDNCVETPILSIADLLSLLPGMQLAASGHAPAIEVPEASLAAEDVAIHDSGSEEEAEVALRPGHRSRLSALFGMPSKPPHSAGGTPKPKAASGKTGGHVASAMPKASRGGFKPPALPKTPSPTKLQNPSVDITAAGARAASALPSFGGTVLLDGRTKRIKESTMEIAVNAESQLKAFTFMEDLGFIATASGKAAHLDPLYTYNVLLHIQYMYIYMCACSATCKIYEQCKCMRRHVVVRMYVCIYVCMYL